MPDAAAAFFPRSDAVPWLHTPAELSLCGADAHVWRASLVCGAEAARKFWETLSEDERERADRFHFEKDRARYIAARGTLRAMLSRYTAAPPSSLRFSYSARGKPALAEPRDFRSLEFNLAHSRDLAVFAFARGRAVGVDVEAVDESFPFADVAPDVFTDEELRWMNALDAGRRREAFFSLWTCKEALLKARGDGLSADPRSIGIAWENETPQLRGDGPETAAWSLQGFDVCAGCAEYRAALATRGKTERILFFHHDPPGPARGAD